MLIQRTFLLFFVFKPASNINLLQLKVKLKRKPSAGQHARVTPQKQAIAYPIYTVVVGYVGKHGILLEDSGNFLKLEFFQRGELN